MQAWKVEDIHLVTVTSASHRNCADCSARTAWAPGRASMYYEIFDTTMDISGASVPRGRAIFLRYDYTRRSQYGV
jgi:hypothetical protein